MSMALRRRAATRTLDRVNQSSHQAIDNSA
jgi:hypothetical protein